LKQKNANVNKCQNNFISSIWKIFIKW
jgi:hypothetical protein